MFKVRGITPYLQVKVQETWGFQRGGMLAVPQKTQVILKQKPADVQTKMKTKKLQCGDTTITIKESPPFRLLDMAFGKFQKLEDADKEMKATILLDIKKWILKEMVVEPKVDDRFLDEEADGDIWVLSFDLLAEIQESIQKRMEEVKKKHPKLSDSQPPHQD